MLCREKRVLYSFTLILTILMLLSLTACGHRHDWKDASCTAPKTCAGCGETEGEKTRHNVPEDGVCTLCKRKLSNVLKLEKKSRPSPPAVYGGAKFRIYITGMSDVGVMFPGTYTIYAEDGTEMTSGDWGTIRPVVLGPGLSGTPDFVDTEYAPLQPGNYRVEFTYYADYWYDDEETKTFVPLGDSKLVNYPFIVR